jgi:hypothetical protein
MDAMQASRLTCARILDEVADMLADYDYPNDLDEAVTMVRNLSRDMAAGEVESTRGHDQVYSLVQGN